MIINCPECELQVSDKAYSCPHCGFPLKEDARPQKPRRHSSKEKDYQMVLVKLLK